MRVYVPSTLGRLREVMTTGVVPAGPAHAVTAAVREAWPEASEEEGEYAALDAAADASAALLSAGTRAGAQDAPRRVVLVLDVAERDVEADIATDADTDEVTSVRLAGDQQVRLLAAVQADTDDLVASGPHDAPELGWFATQEVADLLAAAGPT